MTSSAAAQPADILAQAERKKRKNRRLTLAAVAETAECHDEVFQRVRSVLCSESVIDLDEHAALVALEVHKARSSRRFPPWREQVDYTATLAEGGVVIPSRQPAPASPSASEEA